MIEQESFRYSLSYKNKMLVVSLNGEITNEVLPALEACRSEIQALEEVEGVVLYFCDVPAISDGGVQLLAQIQREIRARPADLRLVSLRESLRTKFERMGLIRALELVEDLKTALLSFRKVA